MGNWGVNCEIARRDGLAAGKSTSFDALPSSFGNSRVLAAMKYSGQANVRSRPNRNLEVISHLGSTADCNGLRMGQRKGRIESAQAWRFVCGSSDCSW